jgi:predicted transcriptional regulator
MTAHPEEFVAFFKAMADANRLKIVGLLAREPMSVEQLAEALSLSPSTTSHHLAKLADVGLVSARSKSYYNIYQFEADALEKMAQRLLSQEVLATPSAAPESDDAKVLATFFDGDGRLRSMPVAHKKKVVMLRHILESFERGQRYPEKELNTIMKRFHDDTAALRRSMIDFRLMARENGVYWRIDE